MTAEVSQQAAAWLATCVDAETIIERSAGLPIYADKAGMRTRALQRLLDRLLTFDGDTWQHRWNIAGCNDDGVVDWVVCLGNPWA